MMVFQEEIMNGYRNIILITIFCLLIAGCTTTAEAPTATVEVIPTDITEPTETATAVPTTTFTPNPTNTPTPLPTDTPVPTPTLTPTPDVEALFQAKLDESSPYFDEGDWQKAINTLQSAIEIDPDNDKVYKAYNGLGLAYDHMGELDLAITNFDQVIELNPSFGDAYANRADVWKAKDEMEKAMADYAQAIELDPTVPRYFYNRATAYKKLGEMELAIADYDQAIELDPEFSYAYHNRANIYKDLGNYDQALADFDKALEYDPTDKLGFFNRALLHWQLNNITAANEDFGQIIELCDPITFSVNGGSAQSFSPDRYCTYAYMMRSEIQYRQNEYESALIDLELGVEGNPSLALDYFDYWISEDPNVGFLYFGRGLAHDYSGNIEDALADYTRAIQLSGSDPMRQNYYLARGIIYAAQGNLDTAIADWQQTIAINPDNADALFNLGMAAQEQEGYETAVQHLITMLSLDIPPDYKIDAANRLLYNAEFLIHLSETQEQALLAVNAYDLLQKELPEVPIPANQLNNLCWNASLWQLAENVIFACETAVEMEPENGAVLDSRGIARALTGDFEGAIEDFQAFIAWEKEDGHSQEEIDQRQSWIESLEANINPFDEALLTQLRTE